MKSFTKSVNFFSDMSGINFTTIHLKELEKIVGVTITSIRYTHKNTVVSSVVKTGIISEKYSNIRDWFTSHVRRLISSRQNSAGNLTTLISHNKIFTVVMCSSNMIEQLWLWWFFNKRCFILLQE